MNKVKSAFTVVEILIAMLILFTAIAFSNMSIKAFHNYERQSKKHEDVYITVLSLKEWMHSLRKFNKMSYEGILNNISYNIQVEKVITKRNYILTQEGGGQNIGNYFISLYRLTMTLTKEGRIKKYSFLLTKQRSIDAKN